MRLINTLTYDVPILHPDCYEQLNGRFVLKPGMDPVIRVSYPSQGPEGRRDRMSPYMVAPTLANTPVWVSGGVVPPPRYNVSYIVTHGDLTRDGAGRKDLYATGSFVISLDGIVVGYVGLIGC